MAYKALYRTYRPNGFDDMAGQKHIIKTLENAVNQNKIAHAYLFCGPRGTGKTSMAKIFAKAVNCLGEVKPCGMCESCNSVDEGNHPDIVEIDAASNNGVEEVRNLIDKVKYAPIKGKYKVYIIDEVHMMSQGAYNALLKTIEEPPAHVIFILATTEPYKVLPTIISRCQRFDFAKISEKDIINRLTYITQKENIECGSHVLETIANLADGGMRDALSILDQCYAYAPEKIELKHVYEIYGIITNEEMLELLESVKSRNTAALIHKIGELDQRGIDIKRLTSDLIELLKEKVIYDYTHDTSLLKRMNKEEVEKLSENNTSLQSLKMIDILLDSYEKFRFASNVISYLEIALLKMMEIVSRETLSTETKQSDAQARFEQTISKNHNEPPVITETIKDIEPEVEVLETATEREVVEITSAVESNLTQEIQEPTITEPEPIANVMSEVILEPELEPLQTMAEEPSKIEVNPIQEESSIIMDSGELEELENTVDPTISETIDEVADGLVEETPRKSFKILEDDFVLRLLVGANKTEKIEDKDQMDGIHQYKLDIEYAKYANLLAPNEIIASGEKFIIVCTNSQALANEINVLDKQGEFLTFIDLLLKRKKKVFAITNIQYERVVEEFRDKHRTNSLPEPIVFEEFKEEVKKDETMESLNILFGNNIDIKEE